MSHSQGLSNNPYPEPNQHNSLPLTPISLQSILILHSYLCLGLPRGFFLMGSPVKVLKAVLPSTILATSPAYLIIIEFNQLYYIR